MRRRLNLAAVAAASLALVGTTVVGVDAPARASASDPVRSPARVSAHLDAAPSGVDVRATVSTSAIVASAGVRSRPAQFRRSARPPARTWTASGAAAPASALSVPAGAALLGGLGAHVSPSCTGTEDGNRVQALYVREAGTASRYAQVRPALGSFVADIDDTFALSSPGSGRRVRWVQDASCVPVIPEVVVPKGTLIGNRGVTSLASALKAAGHNRPSRKYLAFADAATLCGIGQMYLDDSADSANHNNGAAPMYARVDTPCWAARSDYHSTPAHEVMHMLGGVQPSAPRGTAYGHCTDESDAMCYADGSGAPMAAACAAPSAEALFDCNRNDYYDTSTAPRGYLASAWNTARSSFLDVVPALSAAKGTATTSPVAVTVTMRAPSTLYVGATARVDASVTAASGPVATGVALQSWTRATGWRTVASGITSGSGAASFALRPTSVSAVWLRVLVPASPAVRAGASRTEVARVVRR